MILYLDSSVILELYLEQPRAAEAERLLALPDLKFSSWLLAVEVPVVLRRALGARAEEWLVHFDEDLLAIGLYEGVRDVAKRVRDDARLSRCRSLDAVHVATALILGEELDQSVRLASFDDKMREVAAAAGLAAVP